MKKLRRILSILLAVSMILPQMTVFARENEETIDIQRIAGNDRYQTSAKIADELASSHNKLILASGENYPDALSVSILSEGKYPILLTNKDSLNEENKEIISKSDEIVILGGKGSISEKVEAEISSLNSKTTRIYGKDRYESSVNTAKEFNADHIIIASGENFPDALAGGPLAIKNQSPILLVKKDEIPKPVKDYIISNEIKTIDILGGESAISNDVEDELSTLVDNVRRIAGKDRVETSLEIAREFENTTNITIASAKNYPDALSASPLANGPIILVADEITPEIKDYLLSLTNLEKINIIGGTASVIRTIEEELINLYKDSFEVEKNDDENETIENSKKEKDEHTDTKESAKKEKNKINNQNDISINSENELEDNTLSSNFTQQDYDASLPEPGEMYSKQAKEENIIYDEEGFQFYINNQILLIAEEGTSKEKVEEVVESIGGKIVGRIELTDDYQIEFSRSYGKNDLEMITNKLKENEFIYDAMLNTGSEITFDSLPSYIPMSEGYKGEKWDVENPMGKNWNLEAIDAMGAWELLQNNNNYVKVGVYDTVFHEHEDIVFTEIFNNDKPIDEVRLNELPSRNDHGNHVAGTIAARHDNDKGILGVAPKVRIYGFPDLRNNVDKFTEKEALAKLITIGCRVINYSYGFKVNKENMEIKKIQSQLDAIFYSEYLLKFINLGYDFVIVQSAGNNKVSATHNGFFTAIIEPEIKDRTIIVGSVGNKKGGLFDNIHKEYIFSSFSNHGERVDVVAPGEEIYSLSSAGYEEMKGTSMAAPHVSGIATMYYQANSSLTGKQVKEIIVDTALDNKIITRKKDGSQYPLVNAKLAVEKALSYKGLFVPKENSSNEKKLGVLIGQTLNSEENIALVDINVIVEKVEEGKETPVEYKRLKSDKVGQINMFLEEGTYNIRVINGDDYLILNDEDECIRKNIIINTSDLIDPSLPIEQIDPQSIQKLDDFLLDIRRDEAALNIFKLKEHIDESAVILNSDDYLETKEKIKIRADIYDKLIQDGKEKLKKYEEKDSIQEKNNFIDDNSKKIELIIKKIELAKKYLNKDSIEREIKLEKAILEAEEYKNSENYLKTQKLDVNRTDKFDDYLEKTIKALEKYKTRANNLMTYQIKDLEEMQFLEAWRNESFTDLELGLRCLMSLLDPDTIELERMINEREEFEKSQAYKSASSANRNEYSELIKKAKIYLEGASIRYKSPLEESQVDNYILDIQAIKDKIIDESKENYPIPQAYNAVRVSLFIDAEAFPTREEVWTTKDSLSVKDPGWEERGDYASNEYNKTLEYINTFFGEVKKSNSNNEIVLFTANKESDSHNLINQKITNIYNNGIDTPMLFSFKDYGLPIHLYSVGINNEIQNNWKAKDKIKFKDIIITISEDGYVYNERANYDYESLNLNALQDEYNKLGSGHNVYNIFYKSKYDITDWTDHYDTTKVTELAGFKYKKANSSDEIKVYLDNIFAQEVSEN